jgi:alpha-mannosidase
MNKRPVFCQSLHPFLFLIFILASFLHPVKAEQKSTQYYMIGHAHIDPVWRWTRDEGYAEVFSTFRSILDRMKEYPDVAFVGSSAQFYDWVLENNPEMFAEIKQRVQEGRWTIVSGWWVEADVNCISGESMVRQGLYGQTFFQRHFGRTSRIGFGPDTFGHPWTLPQILLAQGMDSYFYMRPEMHEKPDTPAPIFNWYGQDGSPILTFSILHSYNGGEKDIEGRIGQYDSRFKASLPAADRYAVFYGMGNHGGGPTIAAIEKIHELAKSKFPGMKLASLEKYVDDVRAEKLALPDVRGELQHHARGCYSACLEVKQNNRRTEAILQTAEKLAAINVALLKKPYSAEPLRTSWHKVLFNQFHDILAGSAIERAYVDARNDYGYAQSVAMDVITQSLHSLTQQIDTADPSFEKCTPFIVFNPCSWPQTVPVEIEMQRIDRNVVPVLRDAAGKPVPCQILTTAGVKVKSRVHIVFDAELPSFGYHLYRIDFSGTEGSPIRPGVMVTRNSMENQWVRVTFDTLKGTITSYFDKKAQRELLAAPAAAAVVLKDWDDTWGHKIVSYDQEIGRFDHAASCVLEQGPERGCLQVQNSFGRSTLVQNFMLSANSADLVCHASLDWQEKYRVLKISFPTVFAKGTLTYSTPYGFIERSMNGEEEPGQVWIDITSQDQRGAYGLAILNDFACGYSVKDGDMRMTVLHSTAWSHHNPEIVTPEDHLRYMEQGSHEFTYRLVPHAGDWREAGIARAAQSFMEPPRLLITHNHKGVWPKQKSFLNLNGKSASITVAKVAEDGAAIILRCLETNGRQDSIQLSGDLMKKAMPITLRPAEIKTVRIPLTAGHVQKTTSLLEN